MKYIKLSFFLKSDISPLILGAFLSRTKDVEINGQKFFLTYTHFKKSKILDSDLFPLDEFGKKLEKKLNYLDLYKLWTIKKSNKSEVLIEYLLQNDLGFSKSDLHFKLQEKLFSSNWVWDSEMNENHKSFIRGFMEMRGSVDTKAKFLSQDYFYDSTLDLKKGFIIVDQMNIPSERANFNIRNLQPQFLNGVIRNTQFRIDLLYYANQIGFLNEYKSKIFEETYGYNEKYESEGVVYFHDSIPNTKKIGHSVFIKNLNFYSNNIYEKNLTPDLINKYRTELGHDRPDSENNYRNPKIVEIFKSISDDKCGACGTYKTFEGRAGKEYFEIHHVISLYNGKELDNIANLVKLCPICHTCLKRNRAKDEEQIKIINLILKNNLIIYEFTSAFLGISEIDNLCKEIHHRLG